MKAALVIVMLGCAALGGCATLTDANRQASTDVFVATTVKSRGL